MVASLDNCRKNIRLAKGTDILFIEGAFLESERATAREAGDLAKKSGARHMQLFHFSPRYRNRAADLEREAREAFETGMPFGNGWKTG